jgi:histidinol-phosphate aminotransferase
MIYLDRNENLYGPAPECLSILRSATGSDLSMYSRDFMRGVKSILSETLAKKYEVPENQVLLSYGSEDMLKQIVHCYLSPGETMMIPHYSWWYYKSVAEETGGKVLEYPLKNDSSTFYYDCDEIVTQVHAMRPRLLLFASPNNPTGNSLPENQLISLLESCPDTMIVLDEAYTGFSHESHDEGSLHVLRFPNLAILRTFSKLYALAGIRIGYCFAGPSYQKLVKYSHRYLGYNTLSESLALAALRDQKYYSNVAATITEEREKYYKFFNDFKEWRVFHSDANFLLVRVPSNSIEQLKQELHAQGIAIKFFAEKEFLSHIRITIGTPEHNAMLRNALKHFYSIRESLSSTAPSSL